MDCGKCYKFINEKEIIKCNGCTTSLHYSCANLTEAEFKKILPMNKHKWKCNDCKLGNTAIKSSTSATDTSNSIVNIDTGKLMAYLDQKFEVLRKECRNDIKDTVNEVKSEIKLLGERMDRWEQRVSKLEERTNTLMEVPDIIESIKEENNCLRDELVSLNAKFEELNQTARNCNVEIQNVPQFKGENLLQIVHNVGTMVGVNIPNEAINSARRVAHATRSDRPRNIIVQLSSRRLRDEVVAAARVRRSLSTAQLLPTALADDPSTQRTNSIFYVNEHLTTSNKILLRKTKQKAKELDYKYVWVKNGSIMVRKNDGTKLIKIRDEYDLQKI